MKLTVKKNASITCDVEPLQSAQNRASFLQKVWLATSQRQNVDSGLGKMKQGEDGCLPFENGDWKQIRHKEAWRRRDW